MTVARQERLRRGAAAALEICIVAAVYYGSAKLGLLQQLVRGQVTPLWPPTGIAVASLLLRGPRVWPGIALGALLVNAPLGPSLPAVLAIVVGNTLAPVCSYALLRRTGFGIELDRLRDVLALIFLGAFTGMLVSATIGSGTLALAGVVSADGFWPTWSVWWTGDAMGVLVVTPVLLVLRSARRPKDAPPSRWAEGFLLLVATACVGLLDSGSAPLMFLGFPLLIWAAFRFQLAGAAPCALAVSTFTIVAAARGSGLFAGHDLLTNMITLQAFNASSALTALLVAAAVSERNQSQKEISQACGYLAEMVAKISAGGYERTLTGSVGEMNRFGETSTSVKRTSGKGEADEPEARRDQPG
ncbi:MASE1 domain-containing protein [Streptomyces sp. NPDC005480]|uniref:MASE1 domain-containing protein n=1 Tax=Streptomyces sp. NPDC005480 TaxID=3154880 RepID=UPI0033AD624B